MTQAIPQTQDNGTAMAGFNFHVAIELPDLSVLKNRLVCDGAFADVTGLEATMDAKVIRVGGRNSGPVQRTGAVTFPTVVLRRGMTDRRDLWLWWNAFIAGDNNRLPYHKSARAMVHITQLDSARQPVLVWRLARAMPVKFKAGDLSARSAEIAVEELHLVHEGLSIELPAGSPSNGSAAGAP
jgi:phage tail-like protein